MQRLPALDPRLTAGSTRTALDQAETRLGGKSTLLRTMANSPAALRGYLALERALSAGTLHPRLRVQIGLAVTEVNACQHCLATHAAAGTMLGLDKAAITAARRASSPDPKVKAALQFARGVAQNRGDLTDEEFDRVRRAGYDDEEIAEILANVVFCLYANYLNTIARPEVDVG